MIAITLDSKKVAYAAVYAGLYAGLVAVMPFISYGVINVRVANMMLGAVPFLGAAGVAGQTIGCIVANTFSPLGLLDMLNVIPTFVMTLLIWKLKGKSALIGLTAYAIVTSVSIAAVLSVLFGVPYLLQYGFVLIGQIIACVIGGYIINKSLGRLHF